MKFTALCILCASVPQMGVAMRGLAFSRDKPNTVAKILAEVEQKWLNWSLLSVDCDTANATGCNGANATAEFQKSCTTVAMAIIKTSAGDKTRLQSYMVDTCGSDLLKGVKEELCLDFSQVLGQEMSDYQHENLEGKMDLSKVCMDIFHDGYLGRYAAQEGQRLRNERAAKAAEEQRKADERAAAEAQKELDEKSALALKRLEEMANATATVTSKREEAVAAAVQAQRKAEQVEEAEQVQKRLQAEADAAYAAQQAVKARLEKHLASKGIKNATLSIDTEENVNKTHDTKHVKTSFLASFPYTFS